MGRKPSHLSTVIRAIADMNLEEKTELSSPPAAFRIGEKIAYNQIHRNAPMIEEYKAFYTQINSMYQILETQDAFKKQNLLRNIKLIYTKIKGRYFEASTSQAEWIQKNADNIIEDVQDELLRQIENVPECCDDDAAFAISLLTVDAFIRCKILEAPPQ